MLMDSKLRRDQIRRTLVDPRAAKASCLFGIYLRVVN